jgi:outer membrane protein
MKKSALVFFALTVSVGSFHAAGQEVSGQQAESRTLTLQEVVRLALSRSPEVLLAETQAGRARESIREIRSLNRPQVFTGTGLAYNNGYPLSMEGAAPSIVQFSASQSIFSKKNSNLIREAEETEKASSFGTDSVRNELVSKTALVYYRLYQSRRLVDLASKSLEVARAQQEQVETLREAGRVRPVEATLARTATQRAQHQLQVAQEQKNLSEIELRQLTGLPETVTIETSAPQIENPAFSLPADTLYQQALERTPEILQSEASARAKEFHVEAEKGERLPKADIIGQYALFSRANNYADYFNRFSRNNFLLGLSFQVPLFDGFRTSSRVAQSKKEVSEARYRVESLKSDLRLTIERCLSALRIAHGALELAQSEAAAARETIRVNETLLEAGKISPQDMEESRALLQQKELALLETDQTVFERKLDLLRAIGAVSTALQ